MMRIIEQYDLQHVIFELSEPTLEARTKSEMTDFLSTKKGLTFEIDKISRNLYDYCT